MYIYIYINIHIYTYIHIYTSQLGIFRDIFFLGRIFRGASAHSLAVGKREAERPISSVTFHLRQRALYFRKRALYLRKSDMYFRVAVGHISIYTFVCVCVYIYIYICICRRWAYFAAQRLIHDVEDGMYCRALCAWEIDNTHIHV